MAPPRTWRPRAAPVSSCLSRSGREGRRQVENVGDRRRVAASAKVIQLERRASFEVILRTSAKNVLIELGCQAVAGPDRTNVVGGQNAACFDVLGRCRSSGGT